LQGHSAESGLFSIFSAKKKVIWGVGSHAPPERLSPTQLELRVWSPRKLSFFKGECYHSCRDSQSASGASACAAWPPVRHVLPSNPGVRRKRSGGDPSRAARALSARGSGAMTPIPVGSSVGACDAHDSAARLVTARRGGATGRVRGASGSRFPERVLLTSLKPSCCAFMFLLAGRFFYKAISKYCMALFCSLKGMSSCKEHCKA
jgi:hypothetical protein